MNAAHRNYRQSHADLLALQAARRAAELREVAEAAPPQAAPPSPQRAEKEAVSPKLASFCENGNSRPEPASPAPPEASIDVPNNPAA
jgi:hypothetical protein